MFTYARLAPILLALLPVLACSAAPDDVGVTSEEISASCGHHAGSHAKDTLDNVPSHMPVKHIIIVMQENRSFDHMLGSLRLQGRDVDGIPDSFVNHDAKGKAVHFMHRTDTCFDADSPHNEEAMEASIDGEHMDSFVKSAATSSSDGHYVMSYYTEAELPFYYFLAKNYAISDRYFSGMIGPTDPNRDFLYAATSNGITVTSSGPQKGFKGVRTIYDELDQAKVSWGVYSSAAPRQAAIGWDRGHKGVHGEDAFFDALEDDKLPSVVFLDPGMHEDEHPPHDVQGGEGFAKRIYDAVTKSKIWNETALFYTYDEAGGIADHVPPPPACAPSAKLGSFDRYGVRVPVMLVSPYAKRSFVSHKIHSHTSILRFVELAFDLPALTERDANADAMLDMFDFSQAKAPEHGAPSAGHGACKNDPSSTWYGDLGQDLANDWDKLKHGWWH